MVTGSWVTTTIRRDVMDVRRKGAEPWEIPHFILLTPVAMALEILRLSSTVSECNYVDGHYYVPSRGVIRR